MTRPQPMMLRSSVKIRSPATERSPATSSCGSESRAFRLEAQDHAEAHEAQDAQRIGVEGVVAHHPEAALA